MMKKHEDALDQWFSTLVLDLASSYAGGCVKPYGVVDGAPIGLEALLYPG